MGSPLELPPAFTLQSSLIGGGIHRFSLPKRSESVKHATSSSSTDASEAKDALAALGPPSDEPSSFLLSKALSNGSTDTSISILNLPRTNPSLDRLGSLTRLASQANETAKDLNTTLSSPPKINPGLDRLMSLSSVVSEDGEATKNTKQRLQTLVQPRRAPLTRLRIATVKRLRWVHHLAVHLRLRSEPH
ncbi:hypothetical protein GN244_ATG15955 [Phytophthora infestans]|uniref:Uncharacterized protein n=1 Tax=Phytophthora infestans TaxID=4787 RepID=A0A833T1Q2_PHYIN|nr:hypothetical protein GN244_ATG15955 [Phytophthora infestans]